MYLARNTVSGDVDEKKAESSVDRECVAGIQRARLFAAMVEMCGERGAANVTVAHVVQRAGVSRRTFYELFDDREDCFLGAFEDSISRASRFVLEAYDRDAKWAERIRAALVAALEFFDAERDIARLIVIESLGGGPRALARRQDWLDRVAAAIDEGRGASKLGGELSSVTAEGLTGAILAILHSRLTVKNSGRLSELAGSLMGMIVLPYLGSTAARKELGRPAPKHHDRIKVRADPLRELDMRLTYRTVRVLTVLAAHPGSSNRKVAEAAGIADQGQASKLLNRLEGFGVARKTGLAPGGPNAWVLTDKGLGVERAMNERDPDSQEHLAGRSRRRP